MIRFIEPRGHHNTGSDNFYYNYSFSTTTVHSLGIVNRLQTLHMTGHRMFDWQLDKRETQTADYYSSSRKPQFSAFSCAPTQHKL